MILRRRFNGAKLYTEAWEQCYSLSFAVGQFIREANQISSINIHKNKSVYRDEISRSESDCSKKKLQGLVNNTVGRRASYMGRSRSESGGGLYTSENAGMSSENYVRIIMAERLRF